MKPSILLFWALCSPLVATANTVVFYHFNGTSGETATNIVDSGPLGYDGTVIGTASYSSNGPMGSCLDLTGDFNLVAIEQSTNLALSNSWTVEMMFRVNVPYVNDGSDPACLINKLNTPYVGDFLDSFCMQLGSAGVISAQIGYANLTGQYLDTGSSKNYSDGQWHHVALVYSVNAESGTNTVSIYGDYNLVSTVSAAFPALYWDPQYPVNIGAGNYTGNDPYSGFRRNFDGQVDEVRISDVALAPWQFVGAKTPVTVSAANAGVFVSWPSVSNETYQVQTRTDFGTGGWTNSGSPIAGTGSNIVWPDLFVPGRKQQFYRLLLKP